MPPAPPRADDHLRVTPAERSEAQERLRHAVVNESIDLDEYGERLRVAMNATTRRGLRQAVDDLAPALDPQAADQQAVHPVRRDLPERRMVLGVLGADETTGRWRPAETTSAVAVMGGADVDLRQAEFDGDRLTINAMALMGGIDIIVPEGVEVTMSGVAFMGGRSCKINGTVTPGAPHVHVNGYAFMGGIDVRHPSKRERRKAERDGEQPDPATVPLRSPTFRTVARPQPAPVEQRRRRAAAARGRIGRALAGLALATAVLVPTAWTLSSDDRAVSVFGGSEHVVQTFQNADGQVELVGDGTVGALVLFGGVDIVVPEGVNVERDGVVIFGGSDVSDAAAGFDPEAPTVTVRTFGGFGSVDILRPGEQDS